MALTKREIVILSIIFPLQAIFAMLSSARLTPHSIGTTLFDIFIYFTLCYLYIDRISTSKWKLSVSALCLCVIIVIISVRFYHHPRNWEFVTPTIYGINTVAMVAFLMMHITNDQRSTVLFTAFIAEVSLVVPNLAYSEQIFRSYSLIVSIILYILLSTFLVKQLWHWRLKVLAISSIIIATMVLGILIRIYWHRKKKLFLWIAIINGGLSIVPWMWLMTVPKFKSWWQARHENEMIQDEQYDFLEMAGLPTRFTINQLEAATTNFQTPIGEGASGSVFKGILPDGTAIAVKRIKWQQSGATEFQTEMTIIASRQHINLVRLLGFCLHPRGHHYLIYPFLENGSLDSWLFKDDKRRRQLSWLLRYHIAIDVANALVYLHHECHHRILHLDIKPANILLDGDFRALLSDFGISKLIGKDENSVMTKARGTVGYLAPEMLVPDAISTKSDVYSYGMVLLELIGGRKNLTLVMDEEMQQRRSSYLPKIAREKMMQGEIMEIVDKSLVNNETIREEEVTVLTRLALWCIQDNPMLRPDMIEVVEVLEGRKVVDVPPESSMFVVNFLDVKPQCSTSREQEDETTLISANNLSISIQSGR